MLRSLPMGIGLGILGERYQMALPDHVDKIVSIFVQEPQSWILLDDGVM